MFLVASLGYGSKVTAPSSIALHFDTYLMGQACGAEYTSTTFTNMSILVVDGDPCDIDNIPSQSNSTVLVVSEAVTFCTHEVVSQYAAAKGIEAVLFIAERFNEATTGAPARFTYTSCDYQIPCFLISSESEIVSVLEDIELVSLEKAGNPYFSTATTVLLCITMGILGLLSLLKIAMVLAILQYEISHRMFHAQALLICILELFQSLCFVINLGDLSLLSAVHSFHLSLTLVNSAVICSSTTCYILGSLYLESLRLANVMSPTLLGTAARHLIFLICTAIQVFSLLANINVIKVKEPGGINLLSACVFFVYVSVLFSVYTSKTYKIMLRAQKHSAQSTKQGHKVPPTRIQRMRPLIRVSAFTSISLSLSLLVSVVGIGAFKNYDVFFGAIFFSGIFYITNGFCFLLSLSASTKIFPRINKYLVTHLQDTSMDEDTSRRIQRLKDVA